MRTITERIKQNIHNRFWKIPTIDRWLVKKKTIIRGELRVLVNGSATVQENRQYLVVELEDIPIVGMPSLNSLDQDGKQLYAQGICESGITYDFEAVGRSGDFMMFAPPKEVSVGAWTEFRMYSEMPITIKVFWRCTSHFK